MMEQQKTLKTLKEDILALLLKAQETKDASTSDAITILYDAAKLLPSLVSDNDKTSERVLTQDNSTQEVLYLSKRGNILYELKDYEGAATCYKDIIAKVPKSYEMIRAYGDCLRKQDLHTEAIKQYEIALKVCDKDDFSTPAEKAGLLNSRGLSYIGLKDYQKALADFDEAIKLSEKNPLYHCNKGHAAYALGDKENKEIAMNHFKRANELVKSGDLGDLTKDNIGYIDKTLEEFINKLEELDQIPLEIEDHIMTRRVTKYVAGIVRQISLKGNEEVVTASKNSLREQGNELETAKKKLSYVKKDLHLRHYYDGFVYKLSESFITSVNVMSETFVLDTGSTPLSILTTAISLLPLVGDQLSQGIESIYTFVKERSVKKAATNITQCASSIGEFEELAQDIVCEVILKREAKIKELKDADVEAILLPNWASRFQPVINKIHKLGQDLDVFWNGERNKKPLQKLGYSTAINLVSETISKEEYWKPDDVIDLDLDVRKQKLVESALRIMDDLFDSTKKLVPPPIQKGVPNKADKGNKAHKKDKSDCQLF